jgi:hypothetical protein
MYQNLGTEAYEQMTLEQRIDEMRKWVEDQVSNYKAILRAIAGTIPESDPDIDTVITVDLRDLPPMINDFDGNSTAHAILKYRLENSIETCDSFILDSDIIGHITAEICSECDEEDNISITQQRNFADELLIICGIFGFKDLASSISAWRP